MANETYTEWLPIPGFPDTLWVEALHDDSEGFRIVLRWAPTEQPLRESSRIRVLFRFPLAYRWFDHRLDFHLHPYSTLETMRTDVYFFDSPSIKPNTSFYTVENSVWLDTIHTKSRNLYRNHGFKHFVLHTANFRIEAVSAHDPKVEWVDA
jgi:hypothetical protein